jgi:hypothetical protein
MKTMRLELANEGRTDILEKVMAYRGGQLRESLSKSMLLTL